MKIDRAGKKRTGQSVTGDSPTHASETTAIPIDKRVGTVVRRRRQDNGLTLAELASGADMSSAMLSRIENGQAAASLDVLERICGALGVGIATLFSELDQKQGSAQLIKAADQLEVVRSGTKHGHTYRLLSYNLGPRKLFEPFLIEMDKESERYPRFQHPGTEMIYMLNGQMQYQFGDKTYLLKPGDAFTFSGEVEHGPAELLTDKVQFICVIIYVE
ncbi:MAG: hypothetical protein RLZZ413_3570 [Pseudomonadota bacterium]